MLAACYLQNTTPGSLQAGEISALPIPCRGEWHHRHFQGAEREVSPSACPGPPSPPLLGHWATPDIGGDAVGDRKLPRAHPEMPGWMSGAASSHRGAALHLLPGGTELLCLCPRFGSL